MTFSEAERAARSMWRHVGDERPPFAAVPGEGQESVWDYPRPPRLSSDAREVIVRTGAVEIARTRRAMRVLETASPPTFYLPPEDVRTDLLEPAAGGSVCEWKGRASYWSVVAYGERLPSAAWSYPRPTAARFEPIAGWFSFYPARLDCFVDGVRVAPQPGRFYGGWVTPDVIGPFKGEPGTESW